MNDGQVGRQARRAAGGDQDTTLAPSLSLPNTTLEVRGWGELLNAAYGMGRWTASYRGHLIAYHGGDLAGFHSQVSSMPYDGDRRHRSGDRQPRGAALQHRGL